MLGKKVLGTALICAMALPAIAGTLQNVVKQGYIKCGVNNGLAGFSEVGPSKKWKGLDVDVCRAIAAAVLGNASKVRFVPLDAKERFTALQTGEIDVLSRNTTWTESRDSSLGINFAGVDYYDGQGFLVSKKLGIKHLKDLNGASICINAGTTTELNVADYFSSHHLKYKSIDYDTTPETTKAFQAGRCDAITSDRSQLAAERTKLKNPKNYVILPEIISKEPLGPSVRQGDDVWFNIVKWSYSAMVEAEELGITSQNVDKIAKTTSSPTIKRFLGITGTMGKNLHINKKWAYNIVKQVGNYGQSYKRNVGMDSALKIPRGINKLWNKGGLQFSPPFD